MATCARDSARRAARNAYRHAIALDAGRRTAPRARRARLLLPLLTPHFSHRCALFLSIFSLVSTEHHIDAITVTSLHSGFHRPQHRSPSSSVTVAVLFSSHLLASMVTLPVSSSSRHHPSRLLFLSTSDYYLDHRRRLLSLFLSPAPPSASRHHLPCVPLSLTVPAIHRRDPPSLLHLPSSVPISGCASLHFAPHRRLPLSASPTSPASLSPSAVPAVHRRSPPPCCRAPLPLPPLFLCPDHHHQRCLHSIFLLCVLFPLRPPPR